MSEILRQKNPDLANYYETWNSKYAGVYTFETNEQKAKFYEGILEMARSLAMTSISASIKLGVSNDGADCLEINAVPKKLS